MLSDNGPEFASRNHLSGHPLSGCWWSWASSIATRGRYRPNQWQVERFWRTLNENLIDGTTFENVEEFKRELAEYLLCYNELRPHQGIHIKTPKQMNDSLSDITTFFMIQFCQRIGGHIPLVLNLAKQDAA